MIKFFWKSKKKKMRIEQEEAELRQAQPAKHKLFRSNGAIFFGLDCWWLYCWIVGLLDCWIVEALDCWIVEFLNCWIVEVLKCWNVELLNCWMVELLNCWIIELLKNGTVKLLNCWIIVVVRLRGRNQDKGIC